MIFRRKIEQSLLRWKRESEGKTAFFLEGARRIGKSTVAEEFARREYDDYMILDFAVEKADVRRLFVESLDNLDDFYRNLFLLKGRSLPRRKAVLVLDEIQMFPEARQAVKYLVKDGRYDFIETGSLISLKRKARDYLIPSEEERVRMFPMDFEEFLWANGDEVTMPAVRAAFESRKPLGDVAHRRVMERFRTYMAVGGMPQAVSLFAEKRPYAEIDRMKRSILALYAEDIHKYDETAAGIPASAVFRTVPEQLSHHGSLFRYSSVNGSARKANTLHAIGFLAESMICTPCYNVTQPMPAFDLFADRGRFKLYLGDTGLLVTQAMNSSASTGDDLYKALIFGKLGLDVGMIVENAVAQQLRSSGRELYFHEFEFDGDGRSRPYEIDFLVVRGKKVCPLEVKSSGYDSHKSIDVFSRKYDYRFGEKILVYTKDLNAEGGILRIPLYMASLV